VTEITFVIPIVTIEAEKILEITQSNH